MSDVKRYYIMESAVGPMLDKQMTYTPMVNYKTDVHIIPLVMGADYDRLAQECDSVAGKLRTALLDKAQIEAERDAALKQVEQLWADADLYRQWFNAVRDCDPRYLQVADYQAAVRLIESLGMRVPSSVSFAALQAKP